MPYTRALKADKQNTHTRYVCVNESVLLDALAKALKVHPADIPKTKPKLSLSLKGNLGEYGVWELGAQHWKLYTRKYTWSANAHSPWNLSSGADIDIIALDTDLKELLLIEVKASNSAGSGLITGAKSSLVKDFEKLYNGPVQNRISVVASKVLSSLRYQYEDKELEERVKGMIGSSPKTCSGIRLMGVLICKKGQDSDHDKRARAFNRLETKLSGDGWQAKKIVCKTIEVNDVDKFLNNLIEQAMA